MKLIKLMLLLAALFAIAGAAFFQLFVLLITGFFAQQLYHRHHSRIGWPF